MTFTSRTKFFAIVPDWIKIRIQFLIPIIICAAMTSLTSPQYWEYLFEGLYFYTFWPIILTLCSLIFLLWGVINHRCNGQPLYLPHISVFTATALFGLSIILETVWAINWSIIWCCIAIVILFAAIAIIAYGVFLYAEIWRRWSWLNSSVVTTVEKEIENGDFGKYIQNLLAQKKGEKWGSPHCLRIVQGYYDSKKQPLLQSINSTINQEDMDDYFKAGEYLFEYLSLDWPDRVAYRKKGEWIDADKRQRSYIISETLREIITLSLWFKQRQPKIIIDSKKTGEWIKKFMPKNNHQQDYRDFLAMIFQVGNNEMQTDVIDTINRISESFLLVPNEYCETCALTWLAIAPSDIPQQAQFDVWMWMQMCREQGTAELSVRPDTSSYCNPARLCASVKLHELYKSWYNRTPDHWNTGLEGRKNYSEQLIIKPESQNVRQEMQADTQKISSWIYHYVFKSPKVKAFFVAVISFLFVIILIALAAANPGFLGRYWNTIDHIPDHPGFKLFGLISPNSAYADTLDAKATAMAATENWIGIGTEEGFKLVNKNSRLHRENITRKHVLDVSRGLQNDDFLVLNADQSVTRIELQKKWPIVSFWDIKQNIWLPKPANPSWNVPSFPKTDIVANALDNKGWLIAVKDRGIVRYLFGKLPDGRTYRRRSWQTGDFSNAPLDKAIITKKGIWLTLEGGGIKYAERETLKEVSQRTVSTPRIRQFDADYNDQWASAIDSNNSLWLYHAEKGGWKGPFFGNSRKCRLKDISDVKIARLDASLAWIGTRYGLFAYDLNARHMRCVIPDTNIIDIEPIKSSVNKVLVASKNGMTLVERQASDFNIQNIDQDPISSMSLSSDSNLLVYKTHIKGNNNSDGHQIRALKNPSFNSEPITIATNNGWKRLRTNPTIIGVKPLGQRRLFATSRNGAFIYEPESRGYKDASTSLFKKRSNGNLIEEAVTLNNFNWLKENDQDIIAIADGTPQLLRENAEKWISLDPSRETNPVQITEAEGKIFGLGNRGELYQYDSSLWESPEKYFMGKADTLINHPVTINRVRGDLFYRIDNETWKTAFLHRGRLIIYDSANGNIEEKGVPFSSENLSQLRIADGNILYLLKDGSIGYEEEEEKRRKFNSNLPFPPERITAIAPDLDEDAVLLGGPSGQVKKYSWAFGSWNNIGSGIPSDRNVTEIQRIERGGIFARLENNTIWHTWGRSWSKVKEYNRFMTDRSGSNIWMIDEDGIDRIVIPDRNSPTSQWTVSEFGKGIGMKDFATGASFVWQTDKNKIVIIKGSQAGSYDANTDNWEVIHWADFTSPRQFTASSDYLAVLDENKVWIINKNLKDYIIKELPTDAQNVSINFNNREIFQIAFMYNNGVILRIWDKPENKHYSEYKREDVIVPDGFDPSLALYAKEYNSLIYLKDESRKCVSYNYLSGRWERLNCTFFGETKKFNPDQETLLESEPFRIMRKNKQTAYQIFFNDSWSQMTPYPGGFYKDIVKDIAFSPSGKLWVLQGDKLVNFIPIKATNWLLSSDSVVFLNQDAVSIKTIPGGYLRVSYKITNFDIFKETNSSSLTRIYSPIKHTLASLDYAGEKLDWMWQAGNYNTVWRNNPKLPIWGENGKLAIQCIQNITLSDQNEFLVSTKAGILIRDLKTYSLKGWKENTEVKKRTTIVHTGPWNWQLRHLNPVKAILKIFHQTDKHTRKWIKTSSNQWKFKDDVMRWIIREPSDNQLWLKTEDGIYPFDIDEGRGDNLLKLRPSESFDFKNSAIKISYSKGRLSFHPSDGSNQFLSHGRFFFDNGIQMCSSNDDLYFLVPNRGVVRRDPSGPGRITGFWTLPKDPSLKYSLESSPDGILLSKSGESLVWKLDFTNNSTGKWRKISVSKNKTIYEQGPIHWRCRNKNNVRPFLFQRKSYQLLNTWWISDRFAWDHVTSAGSLDDYTPILMTFMGPIALDSTFKLKKIWQISNLNSCSASRNDIGDLTGVAVGNAEGPPKYLIKQNSQNEPFLDNIDPRVPVVYQSVLNLAYKGTSKDRHIGITQSWKPQRNLLNIRESAFSPNLPGFPNRLVSDGQFIFDQADGASPVASNKITAETDSTWVMFKNYQDYQNLITFNQVKQIETGHSLLILRDMQYSDEQLFAVRPSQDNNNFLYLSHTTHNGNVWNIKKRNIKNGEATDSDLRKMRESFFCGEKVGINVSNFAWKSQPFYIWESDCLNLRENNFNFDAGIVTVHDSKGKKVSLSPFNIFPKNYEVFYPQNDGVSLSFDMITSFSMNSEKQEIAVGTHGGVCIIPYNNNGKKIFSLSQPRQILFFNEADDAGKWIVEVERVRYDRQQKLWAKFGQRKQSAAKLANVSDWHISSDRWPAEYAIIQDYKINLGGDGFESYGDLYKKSNDSWWIGQKQLSDIIDFIIDDDCNTLWIATRNAELFKVLLNAGTKTCR
jgi:hypothetical protein